MKESASSKVERFFADHKLRRYPKGQILILNGDELQHVFFLVTGRVKQYDITYRGDEIILNTFKPTAFFPMSMAINKIPSEYIYEAETDIEVRQAPVEEVLRFVSTNPDVMFDLLGRVYRGTDGLLGRIVRLMSSSAKGRLMFELVVECRRFGVMKNGGSCEVLVNEKDLASRSGLSRETVSREIRKLIDEKHVVFAAGKLTVLNLASFEAKLTAIE